jgi:transcriptional regulator with XRE-family HTH domain
MGHPRPRPKRLAEKLLQIRNTLGMSQPKIAKQLGVKDYTSVSKWELNVLEPPLAVLLAYARLTSVPVESLIDDNLDLTL